MPSRAAAPASSGDVVVAGYDALFLDLDGVIFVGTKPVRYAHESVDRARAEFGKTIRFITNNASRPPQGTVEVLEAVGVSAQIDEIVSSAQIAAAYLREHLEPGAQVLVVGGQGLIDALKVENLKPVSELTNETVAIVQGFDPGVSWRDLATASFAVERGLLWVGTNPDMTIPTGRGIAPGNGSLIQAVSNATGKTPVIMGKPFPTGIHIAAQQCNARSPIMIGDRLDTDIEAGVAAGIDTALVMTGVTNVADLCTAPEHQRPTFVLSDLRGLFGIYRHPEHDGQQVKSGGWVVQLGKGGPQIVNQGDSAIDGIRALATACWLHSDNAPLGDLGNQAEQLQSRLEQTS